MWESRMPEVAILKRVRMIDKLFYCGATKTSSIKRPLMMIIICNSNHDRNYHFIWPFCLIADIVYVVVYACREGDRRGDSHIVLLL